MATFSRFLIAAACALPLAACATVHAATPAPGIDPTLARVAPAEVDVDGDGVLTKSDLVAWLRTRYRDMKISDHDGDGRITFADSRVDIARILGGLAGDLNGDGVVDAHDAAILTGNASRHLAGATIADGDLNLDGVVDRLDLDVLSQLMGTRLEQDMGALAQGVIDEGRGRALMMSRAPVNHIVVISDGYDPALPWPDGMPDDYPANHADDYSYQWPIWPDPNEIPQPLPGDAPTPHIHRTGLSWGHWIAVSQWPANHLYSPSAAWAPLSHDTAMSEFEWQTWPSNHNRPISATWNGPGPGGVPHETSVSRSWDPSHAVSVSLAPNPHSNPELPMLTDPSPHLEWASSTWPHRVDVSSIAWPTNHVAQLSGSWKESHKMNLSIYWPGSHHGAVSKLWPAEDDTGWPANHVTDVSTTWGDPAEPALPFWPPGHSIWSTAWDVIPTIVPLLRPGKLLNDTDNQFEVGDEDEVPGRE